MLRSPVARFVAIGAMVLLALPTVLPEGPYRLKPGARGTICLDCHTDFQETMTQRHVHTPVAAGSCADCHDPHASPHGKLLATEPGRICVECHGDVVPESPLSAHAAVVEGHCTDCHDPHATDNPNALLEAGNALCANCHAAMVAASESAEFQHDPVGKGCIRCHDPHASADGRFMLKQSAPDLCLTCHRSDTAGFTESHEGYPVARADCNSCHDPHGSEISGMLWANVHPPVEAGMCDQCHTGPSSADPLQVKDREIDLCGSCHDRMVNTATLANHVHWPMLGAESCSNCHSPHASRQAALLKAPVESLCGECHQDVVRRHERSVTKHPPIEDGECVTCHLPHGSSAPFLLSEERVELVCGNCHDWQNHSTHPLGEEIVDPRNPNLSLNCLTCHRTHGSPYKHLAHGDTTGPLCVDCHEQYQR